MTKPINAEELRLADGTQYREVVLLKRDAAFITIQHADGVAHIPISKLNTEIKRQLQYDPLKAAPLLAAAKKSEAQTQEFLEATGKQEQLDRRRVFIRAVIKDIEPNGIYLVDAVRIGNVTEEYRRLKPTEIGEGWKAKESKVTRVETREIRMEGISVYGIAANLQLGDAWAGYVWPAGERQVKNSAGMVTSMRTRYAATPEIAAWLLEVDRRTAGTKKAETQPNPFEKKPWK